MYNGLAVAVIRGICTESATCAPRHMARAHRQVAQWSGSLPRLHVVCKGAATESKQAQMPALSQQLVSIATEELTLYSRTQLSTSATLWPKSSRG